MRYLLLTILVFALTVPAFAKEFELLGVRSETTDEITVLSSLYSTFGSKSETELMLDNGVFYVSHNGIRGQATTFTAPSDCYLVRLKYGLDSNGATYTWHNDCYYDSSGTPDHTSSYFAAPIEYTGSHNGAWVEMDVSGEGVTFSNGEVFHPYMETETIQGRADNTGTVFGGSGGPVGSNWFRFTNDTWSDYGVLYGAAMIRVFINDDMAGPYADGQDPYDGENNVDPTTDIVFHVKDADIGVDVLTIDNDSVLVDKDIPVKGKIAVTGVIDITGTPDDYTVTFDPDDDFEDGAIVTVTVSPSGNKVTDDLGNEMAEDSWIFNVIPAGVESASLGTIKAEFK